MIDSDFDTRPDPTSAIVNAGKVGLRYLGHGEIGVFGGVSWQTPWDPLLVKVEYDGHDYSAEPGVRWLPQDSRFSIGLHYTPKPGVRLTLGWERGNELQASLALHSNLKNAARVAGPLDPPRIPMRESAMASTPDTEAGNSPMEAAAWDHTAGTGPAGVESATGNFPLRPGHTWDSVRQQLIENAGFYLRKVEVSGDELILHGNQTLSIYIADSLGRTARVLDNVVDPSVEWFTVAHDRQDMPIAQTSVSRSAMAAYVRRDIDLDTMARSIELNPPGSSREGDIVYDRPMDRRLRYGPAPGLKEIIGGPDDFILYQLTANASASWSFSRSTWLAGVVAIDLDNNFYKFQYDAPSNLPRVRTDMRQYVTTSDVTIPNLQLTTTHALGRDL